MRPIVPINQLTRRLPELGRIRTGAKTERAMKALSTFRFTSSDDEALGQIAARYGGTVRPWSDDKAAPNQYEITTEAHEIHVALPPNPLGDTPVYELWGGGGCERRCDGETCQTWVKGPDGPEPADTPCICVAKGEMACTPKTRLNVLLPDVRGIGTWRLETKSWNAAQELPGMVDLIQSLQTRGITRAILRLEHKQSRQAGVTRKFIVPTLGLDASAEALVAGQATVGALGAPAVAQIGAGTAPPSHQGQGVPALKASTVGADRPQGEAADGVNGLSAQGAPPSQPELEVIEAEIVSGPGAGSTGGHQQQSAAPARDRDPHEYPPGWGELTGPAKAKATKTARRLAGEHGLDQPASFEDIDPDLAVATMAAL
jgi:hypothetical protein